MSDNRLSIKFFRKPLLNPAKTMAEGREIYDDVVWIKKMIPGDALNIIERPIYEQDKNEFPLHWAAFKNSEDGETVESGTPLSEWALISRSQAEELRALKFYTVEQIAEASDLALQRMGMMAGMSPYSFRDKAKAFIAKSSADADQSKREEELNALKAENERMKAENQAQMNELREQIKALMEMNKPKPRRKSTEIVE